MKNSIIINGVSFGKKGVRHNGKYFPAHYSHGTLINGKEAITVYAKSLLVGLPAALSPSNDSDMQTDYFEKDRVRFYAGSPEFSALLQLCA